MDFSLWEEPTLRRFVKDGTPWVGPHDGAEEWGRRSSRFMTGNQSQAPFSISCDTWRRRWKIWKWSWVWEEAVALGEAGFSFVFSSHYPTLLLIGINKSIFLWWSSMNDFPVLFLTHKPFIIFSPPVLLRMRGRMEWLGRHLGASQG